jgi:hypothetical protein
LGRGSKNFRHPANVTRTAACASTDAEAALSRPINPNVMSAADWRLKRAEKDSFVARIATQPKVFVIGSKDAID